MTVCYTLLTPTVTVRYTLLTPTVTVRYTLLTPTVTVRYTPLTPTVTVRYTLLTPTVTVRYTLLTPSDRTLHSDDSHILGPVFPGVSGTVDALFLHRFSHPLVLEARLQFLHMVDSSARVINQMPSRYGSCR